MISTINTVTIAKPQVVIDEAVKLLTKEELEKCTIVHCKLYSSEESMLRIWPSTFLIENDGSRRELIKAFNISLMPDWTVYPSGNSMIGFTLVFEGLSKNCNSFQLLEDIPEPGGFYTDTILRNKTDVYQAEVHSKNS
ncbi:MAG: hypothetical protein ABIT58_07045 [Ferruginibacter sp.]